MATGRSGYRPHRYIVGARVRRGPDWTWGDQDGLGLGTIVDVDVSSCWVCVQWDSSGSKRTNDRYRLFGDGICVVEVVQDANTPSSEVYGSRGTPTKSEFTKNTRVKRGLDWQYGNYDSNGMGTVISKPTSDGFVYVQWDNSKRGEFRVGNNGKYDLIAVHGALPFIPVARPTDSWVVAIGSRALAIASQAISYLALAICITMSISNNGRGGSRSHDAHFTDEQLLDIVRGRNIGDGSDGTHVEIVSAKINIRRDDNRGTARLSPTNREPVFEVGTRVRRGPDWIDGNTDDCKYGTVIAEPTSNGMVEVQWDNRNTGWYSVGKDDKYEILAVPGARPQEKDSGCVIL